MDAPGQFNLIWPSSRHLSPKVRVLVDFLAEHLFISEPCLSTSERHPASGENA
ncbi:UNVERIFIED_ORG: hypothetical protein J2W19_004957 [Shinella zoogloeoides]|nr:hypothetical protein [Shinella zoogloeoides]